MNPTQDGIRVVEDDEHFLVIIPPMQRKRAKDIPGRSWDPQKRAWVYEKTIEVYEALEAEFRIDAAEFLLTRTGCSLPVKEKSEPTEKEKYAKRLDDLSSQVSALSQNLNKLAETTADQQEALTSQFEILTQWMKEIKGAGVKESPSTEGDLTLDHFDRMLKELFMEGISDKSPLAEIFCKNHLIDEHLYVLNRLEEVLKKQLRKYLDLEDTRLSLHELIEELNEANSVSSENLGSLKAFKSIRNRIIHEREDSKTKRIQRYIVCTLTLILAWPAISTPSQTSKNSE